MTHLLIYFLLGSAYAAGAFYFQKCYVWNNIRFCFPFLFYFEANAYAAGIGFLDVLCLELCSFYVAVPVFFFCLRPMHTPQAGFRS